MLDEATRRHRRGTDVVVAAVKTDGRNRCEIALADLEVLGGPQLPCAMHGVVDVDALLQRNPEVACLDDLAGVDTQGTADHRVRCLEIAPRRHDADRDAAPHRSAQHG